MAETSEAVRTADNPSAPAAERFDAQVAMHKSMAPRAIGDLIPASDIQPVIDYINNSFEEAEFAKSIRSNIIKFPGGPKKRPTEGGQSVFIDDMQLVSQGSYWDRPGLLNFDSMRAMVEQTPLLSSIIQTRIRQVQRFCRVQTGGVGPGFKIVHKDKTVELGDEQQKSVQLLQDFIANCGWEMDPRVRKRLKRDSFPQFMAKLTRDTLTMDAMPIETEWRRDTKLGLSGMYAVDGATIRLCVEDGYQGNDEIYALQVIAGNIRSAYTYEDLVYEVRNPRTDVASCGYGTSETEMLIRVITYFINTMTYNGSFFDKNSMPRGIMHLVGSYSNEDIASFKRYWNAMVRGVQNVHNVPVMVSKDAESKAEFAEIGGQLNEMAFSKWATFLTSMACAIYGISPEEISMGSFSDGKSSLSGSDTEEKMGAGNDNGKRPLLTHFENLTTDFIIRPFSDQFVFRWSGLDDDDPKQQFEMRKLTLLFNEARQESGYDAVDGPMGDAPLNPALLSVWQTINQAEQPGDFGTPAEPGEEPGQPGGEAAADDGEQDYGEYKPEGEAAAEPTPGGNDAAKSFGLPDLNIHKIEP